MEEFLYILLAIVWLVISLVGNKKKKAKAGQPAPPTHSSEPVETAPAPQKEKEGSEFDDILEEFFGTDTSKPKETKPQPSAQKQDYTPEKSLHDERLDTSSSQEQEYITDEELKKFEGTQAIEDDFEFSTEGKVETLEDLIKSYDDRYRQMDEQDKALEVVELDDEEYVSEEFDFDGRKAIIYAEIINKKYF